MIRDENFWKARGPLPRIELGCKVHHERRWPVFPTRASRWAMGLAQVRWISTTGRGLRRHEGKRLQWRIAATILAKPSAGRERGRRDRLLYPRGRRAEW